MKFVQNPISRIILIVIAVSATLGIIYGINQLGGWLWRDTSLVCRKEKLNALDVTADGKTLITGGKEIRVWDIVSGKKLYDSTTVGSTVKKMAGLSPATISTLNITPDQRLFITAASSLGGIGTQGQHEIQIWDLVNRQLLRTLKGHRDRVRFLAVSPDSHTLVSQDDSGVIQVWNLATGQVRQTLNTERRQRFPIVLSPDGKVFASMNKQGTVTFWNITTGQAVGKLQADPSHTPLAISDNNQTLLIQNAGDVKQFRDIATGRELTRLKGSYIEFPFTVDPRGEQVLIQTNTDLKLYNLLTGVELKTFNMNNFYNPISITPDGQSFLTIDSQDNYVLWNIATGAKIHQLEGKASRGEYEITTAQILVNGDRNGNDLTLWNLTTGERIRKFCNQ
uniref:WD-40 repeat protein n=1 Tax=Cyanothece sp. (strain PCC 7425 / ATCC 29141) TaxID=395961 RepID=B8HZ74_CYAP4